LAKLTEKDPAPMAFKSILSPWLGGHKTFTVKELKNLKYKFQTCQTGAPREYGKIEEKIAPAVLEIIGEWILQHIK